MPHYKYQNVAVPTELHKKIKAFIKQKRKQNPLMSTTVKAVLIVAINDFLESQNYKSEDVNE
jgi:hypothetical protein